MKEKKSRTENEYLEMYGVAPGLEEDMMYADNCRNECPRKIWCSGVDTAWKNAQMRMSKIRQKNERDEKKSKKREEERQQLAKIHDESFASVCSDKVIDVEEPMTLDDSVDDNIDPDFSIHHRNLYRSCVAFPKIPVRDGYQTINEDIMETLVILISYFEIDFRKAT